MYLCDECGFKSLKWLGKCPDCGAWSSFSELKSSSKKNVERIKPKLISEIELSESERLMSGIAELDRTLGGGLTRGSVVLLTGDPGVGKSTLLLQAMSAYAEKNRVLYASGEESEQQIKSRAERISSHSSLKVISTTDIDSILEYGDVDIVAIDSIQTMQVKGLEGIPGAMSQIRECISRIIEVAKGKGISFIVVGHVNKEGKIAGPKLLEHMVDTLLEFEGEKDFQYRILRSTKNRFGSLNEIGIFEMTSTGVREVKNPSEFFIGESTKGNPGSVIAPIIEGNRVFLIELQSLASVASFGIPRRISQGIDQTMVQILCAIADKYLNLNLSSKDIFLNIPGGMRTRDTSIGLSLILSVMSSVKGVSVDAAAIGEVGLTGEVRRVSYISKRVKELKRLGFTKVLIPRSNLKEVEEKGIELIPINNIKEILRLFS